MATATIVVQFGNGSGTGSDATGHLSAEVDSRPDGLNGGKTSFVPGEPVFLLVYKSANVAIQDVATSAGSCVQSGSATVTTTEDVTFENTDESSVQRPMLALSAVEWFGRSLGALSVSGDLTGLKAASKGVAVARVTYTAQADVYRLDSPATLNGSADFTILVVFTGVVQ